MQNAARVPVSAIEEKLLQIMRELSESETVGAAGDFSSANGQSRVGMALVKRLRDAFGVDITPSQVAAAPTVEGLTVVVQTMLDEQRIAAMWASILGLKEVGLDDNFFDVGGESVLLAALQQRIAKEFGLNISIAEMFEVPTVRQQAELTRTRAQGGPVLPPGVLTVQPHGSSGSIFWLHYLSTDLGKVIGDDHPFLFVALAPEDFPTLGKTPTLQSIATCLMRKIMAAQAKGPYTLGGYCLGGILAYEIASQFRAAGHEVSLVVLVDPPNPSYIEACNSLKSLASYVGYAAHRAARLGVRISLDYLREHVARYSARALRTKSTRTDQGIAQRTIELAALKYDPKEYDGKVLLLLASERPPHVNRLAGWQAVVPRELHALYVDSHHRDLLKAENVRKVADAIVSHMSSEPTASPYLATSVSTPADTRTVVEMFVPNKV